MLDIINTHESNVRSYVRHFPMVIERAKNSYIYDTAGREYIDFFSGAGSNNYGHNHEEMKKAILAYVSEDFIANSLDMATTAKVHFIETFVEHILKPRFLDFKIMFTGPTGTNGTEAAIKLARLITGRTSVIAFTHSYHGLTLGALALTSSKWFRDAAGVPLNNAQFVPYDGQIEGFDSAEYLEEVLSDRSSSYDLPAAVIVEGIQGEGGCNPASPEWLSKIREITSRHGILLIIDDIQAGCGRSGDFFSFEESGIHPDLVVLSKSISGYGFPMTLVLIKPEFDQYKPAQHTGTFRGNNLAFVAGARAIELFWTDFSFSAEIKRRGILIRKRLQKIADQYPSDKLKVKGRGFFNGLAFLKDVTGAEAVARQCFEDGLIIEVCGADDEVLKLFPALNIPDEVLEKGLDIIENVIAKVLK
jgi:diaminobutyrate-2-oxoglutarate transaminase